jgi:aspartate aminotransferase-like enzyme
VDWLAHGAIRSNFDSGLYLITKSDELSVYELTNADKILMIPGPTEVAPDILRGMSAQVPAHYMDEWLKLYGDTLRMLRELLYTKNDAFIMTGSSSVSLEGAMCSLVEPGDKVIADEIFTDYARLYGGKVVDVTPPPGEAINPALIQKKLREEKNVKIVAILHNVTWTAVTHPIDQIGETVDNAGAIFVIDAVSSIGGIEIRMDDWHVDVVGSGSQKALAVPPGIAPVAVGKKAWEKIENRKQPVRGVYLDFLRYKRPPIDPEWKWHPTPMTPATTLIRALHDSLKKIHKEGLERVFKRHEVAGKAARAGIKAAGLKLLVKDENYASNTVTAIVWPQGYDYTKFWRTLYDRYNVMVGNPPEQSLHAIEGKQIFRIGHMGNTASPKYILPTLGRVEAALKGAGYPVTSGAIVKAAQDVFLSEGM